MYKFWTQNFPFENISEKLSSFFFPLTYTALQLSRTNKLRDSVLSLQQQLKIKLIETQRCNFKDSSKQIKFHSSDLFKIWPTSSCFQGRCPILQWALNRELSFGEELDVYGRTPVHYAAEEGQITVLRTFAKFPRVHLDNKDFLGRTPRYVMGLLTRTS